MKFLFFPGIVLTIVVTALTIYLTPLRYTDAIEPSIDDITSQEFYDTYVTADSDHLLIDVRSPAAYNSLHAENAINIPLHLFYNERHNFPKKDTEIVLICSGGVASGVAYSYLEHYGFTNIKRIGGGIEGWVDAGLPTESNDE